MSEHDPALVECVAEAAYRGYWHGYPSGQEWPPLADQSGVWDDHFRRSATTVLDLLAAEGRLCEPDDVVALRITHRGASCAQGHPVANVTLQWVTQ